MTRATDEHANILSVLRIFTLARQRAKSRAGDADWTLPAGNALPYPPT